MTSVSAIQSVAQSVGGHLITGVATGILLAILAAILLRVCRNSSTKFAISFFTLLAIAVLPLAACLVNGHTTGLNAKPYISVPASWALGIFLFWMFGAAIGLSRIAIGLWHVGGIRRRCIALNPSAVFGNASADDSHSILIRRLAEFGSQRRVSLCISHDVSVPTAAGFFRPAVLLPAWAVTDLSVAELNSILLHELGHLRRWDDWTNLAQKILKAVLFFHPAMWWIDSRLSLEREIACDDFVLASTSDASGYAQCLVSVAEKSLGRRALRLAVAAVGRLRQTAKRLTRILDSNRPRGTHVSKPALAGIGALTLAFAIALPHIPTLIVFGEGTRADTTLSRNAGVGVEGRRGRMPEVIPASARIETENTSGVARPTLKKAELRRRGAVSSRSPAASKPWLTRVAAKSDRKPTPVLVETSFNAKSVQPTFLVMTQTVLCDGSGACFVSVTAWRVSTVLQQTPTQSQTGSSPKSI